MTIRPLVLTIAALAATAGAGAQDTAPAAFEVASVKRNTSGTTQVTTQVLPNGVNLINHALRTIIGLAYAINQPSGLVGPDWINSSRFDIVARTATEVPSGELRPMLQALLAERFNLAVHTEQRQLTTYALVLARTDGRLGPQLTPSTAECTAPRAGAPGSADVERAPQTVTCGPRPGVGGLGRISLVGSPMSQFAALLTVAMRQTVRDETELTSRYDIDLTYAPVQAPASQLDPSVMDRPSLFTALQEQLGLRLEPHKGEVDVLVIDRIETPRED